ncbi:glycosyltransferase family 4 protein [Aestuariibius insulae]|uniref:glycosyltransferase family 4 protein n=1 Tax=Aestuariibius insulae TaxID=2058287 RepID=UPI00345E1411
MGENPPAKCGKAGLSLRKTMEIFRIGPEINRFRHRENSVKGESSLSCAFTVSLFDAKLRHCLRFASMRVLVLAPQPFMTLRGTPIAIKMMLEGLSARGDTVDVLTFPEGDDVEIANCRLFRLPRIPGLSNIPPGFSLKKLLLDGVMIPYAIARMIRSRYDLVIAVEESAYIAMALRPLFRVPYIADIDSSIPEQLDDKYDLPAPILRALSTVERWACRSAIGAMVCCKALRDSVREHDADLPVQVLEDVTMLDDNDPRPAPKDMEFDEPTIVYVGNLEPYQGIDLLLDGFAGLDPDRTHARLVVIGGNEQHIAENRIRALELGIADRVSFLGPRPVADLGPYLRAATIVTSPRMQGRNTPMKVYSYLDSGRPLLATRLPTHTQVLTDEVAHLVTAAPKDMTEGFEMLLADPDLRDRLATNARAYVKREFTPAAYRQKLDQFLRTEIEPRLAGRTRPVATR